MGRMASRFSGFRWFPFEPSPDGKWASHLDCRIG
jgi:hypothetical protein